MKNSIIVLTITFLFSLLWGLQAGERIVSLGPVVTKQLFLLGVGDEIVGDTTYCNYPEKAKTKTKIGDLVNANIEKILQLKPTLIFATGLTNKKQLEELKRLGIKKIVLLNTPESFNEMCNNLLKIGRAVNKINESERLVKKSREEVKRLSVKTEKYSKAKVFIQIGANPLFAVTESSFINDFIKYAGGMNVVKTKASGVYSREKVVKDNPDVIIISGMGISADSEKKEWEKYKSISAVKNNRIYLIDSYELCSPNPVDFPYVLKKIIKMIHPELDINS